MRLMVMGCNPCERAAGRAVAAWVDGDAGLPVKFTQTAGERRMQNVPARYVPRLRALECAEGLRTNVAEGMQHGMATDTYAGWSAAITQAKLGVTPAELHGSITGFLCAGWSGRARELLDSLALESDAGGVVGENLDGLIERAAARINDRLHAGEPVELVLPEAPLAVRANAAVDWCRGFLGGLGLTGTLAEPAQSAEVAELLSGLGQIAASHLACGENDAAALDDVLDFIRGAAAHLYAAFAPARP